MSSPVFLWAVTVKAPEDALPDIISLLPEDEASQSCFREGHSPQASQWVVETHYREKPDMTQLSLALGILASSRGDAAYETALFQVPVKGWLKANQDSFAPIQAGRFILHGRKDRHRVPPGAFGIEMETSAAFGTGEHPTTFGCLVMLQKIRPLRRHQRALDVGTGSGVLALALSRRGQPRMVGGDMDAESVAVAVQHVRQNRHHGTLRMVRAEGFRHRAITREKPYDVIVSNIFARPLARLAPAMRAHLKAGGRVILAGFLHRDVPMVLRAYASQRIHLLRCEKFGSWSILLLQRPKRN